MHKWPKTTFKDVQHHYCVCVCVCVCVCMHACAQLCLTLCDPLDCSPSGSSPHGIILARRLKGVADSSSRESSRPRDQTLISHMS